MQMHRKSSKTDERAKEIEDKEKGKMWTNRTDKTVIRQEPSHKAFLFSVESFT